jgi:hypothetical protein
MSAAISVPLAAAQRRLVPVIHEGWWGGLRGLNPQPSGPQSDASPRVGLVVLLLAGPNVEVAARDVDLALGHIDLNGWHE